MKNYKDSECYQSIFKDVSAYLSDSIDFHMSTYSNYEYDDIAKYFLEAVTELAFNIADEYERGDEQ